jgi:hypothetical protein
MKGLREQGGTICVLIGITKVEKSTLPMLSKGPVLIIRFYATVEDITHFTKQG